MNDHNDGFEYIGVEHFRIADSTDRAGCLSYLARLKSAMLANDPAAILAAGRLRSLADNVQKSLDIGRLTQVLSSLIERIESNESVAGEIQRLLGWLGTSPPAEVSADTGVGTYSSFEFATRVLDAVIPIAVPDFFAAARATWAEMERRICEDDGGPTGKWRLGSFHALADLVSRVDSPESCHMLLQWLKHERAWVRDSTAWSLRHWSFPDLAQALCEALLLGVEDPAAHEHSFFLLLRLERLADPKALPKLERLIATGYDMEREPPGGPPPGTPKRNMLRIAIRACGGDTG